MIPGMLKNMDGPSAECGILSLGLISSFSDMNVGWCNLLEH